MIFSKRDIQKRQRNGEIIASNTKISNSSNNIGSSGISGNYLPANSSDTGYEVPHYVSFTETINEVTKSLLDIKSNGIEVGGNTLSKGDVVAYFTGESDLVLPIASENALGCIKVGDNLYISEDGTLNASASGGGTWGTITGTLTNQTDLASALLNKLDKTDTRITNWNTAYTNTHTHSNKSYLDVINLGLSISSTPTFAKVTSTGDVVAYSLGSSTAPFKYWKPTVNSEGVISWISSSSEVVPDSVNIKGSDGIGISSIRQTTSSTSSGGKNVWTATLTDGSTSTFTVYNGAAGANGTGGWQSGTYNDNSHVIVKNTGNGGLRFWNTSNFTGCKLGGGNGLVGYSGAETTIGNLYLNYIDGTTNVLINNAGKITYKSVGTWSDMRLKNKIESLDNVIDKIKDLDVFYFNWKDNTDKLQHIGLSAQLVKEVFPDLVSETDTSDLNPESVAYLTVDYSKLSAIAIQAVKELNAKIDKQDEVINELKEQINKLWNLVQQT